jgi:hypothetical protein
MDNLKKNPGFFAALTLAAGLFVAGGFASYLAYSAKTKSDVALLRVAAETTRLLKGHELAPGLPMVSLTADNVKKSVDDLADLTGHIAALRASIAGNPDLAIRGKATINSADLSSLLRQSVDDWRKLALDHDLKLPPNEPCDFGFRRYIRNQGTSPKREFQHVDQQRLIIDYLFRQLVESRPPGSPLLLESIDREPIETFTLIPEGKPGAGSYGPDADTSRNESDEFAPVRTFDRRGQVETLSFRVRFVGYTPTLRTFVNKVRNSGRPFAISMVEVGNATNEIEKLLSTATSANANGAAASVSSGGSFFNTEAVEASAPGVAAVKGGAVEDKRPLALPRRPSAFVVQIDYLSIPEEKPTGSPEAEPKK